jgi:hypothetical protein
MNIDIEKNFAFSSILVMPETDVCINDYDVRLRIRVQSCDKKEYNIAYMRIKHWFYEIMQDAVLIEQNDPRLPKCKNTGFRCIDFPTEPLDQTVGMMLMSKLQAICEDRVSVLQVSIASPRDDYVCYISDHGDSLHWFDEPGWWTDPGPVHCCLAKHIKSSKVIPLIKNQGWKQHDLDWDTQDSHTGDGAQIENFDRDVSDPL